MPTLFTQVLTPSPSSENSKRGVNVQIHLGYPIPMNIAHRWIVLVPLLFPWLAMVPAAQQPHSHPKKEKTQPPPLRPLGTGMGFLTPHRLLALRMGAGGIPDKGRWDLKALMKSFALFGGDSLVIEISESKTDWENLPKLLDHMDRLSRVKAKVWIAIRPPTLGGNSEPFLGAYVRWAKEISKLAKKHPSLVALYIPQIFRGKNLFILHPGTLERMRSFLRPVGVNLIGQFFDLIPENLADYGPLLDGIVLHYTNTQSPLNLDSFLYMGRKVAPRHWKVFGGYSLGPNQFCQSTPPSWLVTYFIRHSMLRCDGFFLDTIHGSPNGDLQVGGKSSSKKQRQKILFAMLQSIRKYWKTNSLPSTKKSK